MNIRAVLGSLLFVALTSCGGGSGTNEKNTQFTGDVFVTSIQGFETTSDVEVIANYGTGNADGAGLFAGSTTKNDGGVITGPFAFDFAYDVQDDRILLFTGGILQGALSIDGSVTALSTIANNSKPQMILTLKKSGVFNVASLSGTYRYGFWRRDSSVNAASMGTMTFDGAGAWTATIEFTNEDGTVANGGTDSGTYTVAADGAVTLTFAGTTDTIRGGMKEGGEVVFLGGTTSTGGYPASMILIKSPASATNAGFIGEYYVAGFSSLNGGGFSSVVGLFTADGAGAMNFDFATNLNGTVATGGGTSGTYNVAGDGTFSMDFGTALLGGISADGSLAFLSGATNTSANPLLLFLIRK